MYLRWKRRKLRRTWEWADGWAPHRLEAAIVASRRVEGKPRQELIAHLGSIREDAVGDVEVRVGFWEAAERRLAALALPDGERARIEAALDDRVRRPTDEERGAVSELRAYADAVGSTPTLGPAAAAIRDARKANVNPETTEPHTYNVKRNGQRYTLCTIGQRRRRKPDEDVQTV
jgi:hypothetical protein